MAVPAKNITAICEGQLRQVLDLSSEGILLLESTGDELRIRYANSQFTRLSGFTVNELTDLQWRDVCRDICAAEIRETLQSRDSYCGTLLMENADGSRWRSGVRVRALLDENGDPNCWLCQFVPPAYFSSGDSDLAGIWFDPDCSGPRQRFGRLDRIDSTSGLLRFERFREFLEREVAMAARDKKAVTLVMFRIMEFEEYRCTFGVNAANSCLGMIGKQITATLRRRTDLCARVNDDTIAVAVVGQNTDDIAAVLERICENVEALRIHNPRGRCSRYLSLRYCVISDCPAAQHDDIEVMLESAQHELESKSVEPLTA